MAHKESVIVKVFLEEIVRSVQALFEGGLELKDFDMVRWNREDLLGRHSLLTGLL